jgi:hypothetical protein
MLNNKQAQMVSPLINNQQVWQGLEEYLNSLKDLTVQGLVTAQSEQEMFRLQGKLGLLETLIKLKDNFNNVMKEKQNG